jgi:hypothetical protein
LGGFCAVDEPKLMLPFKIGDKVHLKFDKVSKEDRGTLSISKDKVGEITWVHNHLDEYNHYLIKVKFDFSGLIWEIMVYETDVVLA